jgi:beta-lactamase class D
LIRSELPVSKRAQEVVREVLLLEERDGARFHGKTGTGTIEDEPPPGLTREARLAWMVGWVELPDRTLVYAMWIEGETADEVRARRTATVDAVLADVGAPARP